MGRWRALRQAACKNTSDSERERAYGLSHDSSKGRLTAEEHLYKCSNKVLTRGQLFQADFARV